MLDTLKSWLTNWKVSVTVIGGALIIATAYGTCTVEPNGDAIEEAVKDAAEVEPATTETTENTPTTIPGTTDTTGTTTETTGTNTETTTETTD
jgi:hypothetical protein